MVQSDKIRKKALAIRDQARGQMGQIKADVLNLVKSVIGLIKTFFSLIKTFCAWIYYQVVVAGYFYLWSYKYQIRNSLRYTTLAAVSASTLILMYEIFLELVGHKRLLLFITRLSGPSSVAAIERFRSSRFLALFPLPDSPHLVKISWVVLLAASVAYLTWHNVEEARKPGYEYHFARAINSFLLDCRIAHANQKPLPVSETLKFCHFIFVRPGIQHVCLHLAVDNILSIQSKHIYPPDEKFCVQQLQPGEGVAGEVYSDPKLHLQYVPRLFFPFNRRYAGWLFPHAVKFQFNQQSVPGTRLKLWQVGNEEINPDVFKRGKEPIPYCSFLSVPLFSVSDKSLLGVLSLDFSKTNALDRAGIAMALVFALLLAGEIRSRNITL
jgi:hypothetical protein